MKPARWAAAWPRCDQGAGVKRARRYGAFSRDRRGRRGQHPRLGGATGPGQRRDQAHPSPASSTSMPVPSPTSLSSAPGRRRGGAGRAPPAAGVRALQRREGLAVAVAAGVDSIEHGFFMSRDVLARMRDRQLAWVPTFCPVHFQWAQPQAVGWNPNTVGNLRRILDAHAEHLRIARELGVRACWWARTPAAWASSMGWRCSTRSTASSKPAGPARRAERRHLGGATPLRRRARHAGAGALDALLLGASPWDDAQAMRQPRQVWTRAWPCSHQAPRSFGHECPTGRRQGSGSSPAQYAGSRASVRLADAHRALLLRRGGAATLPASACSGVTCSGGGGGGRRGLVGLDDLEQ